MAKHFELILSIRHCFLSAQILLWRGNIQGHIEVFLNRSLDNAGFGDLVVVLQVLRDELERSVAQGTVETDAQEEVLLAVRIIHGSAG
jgi:hypothetical protein